MQNKSQTVTNAGSDGWTDWRGTDGHKSKELEYILTLIFKKLYRRVWERPLTYFSTFAFCFKLSKGPSKPTLWMDDAFSIISVMFSLVLRSPHLLTQLQQSVQTGQKADSISSQVMTSCTCYRTNQYKTTIECLNSIHKRFSWIGMVWCNLTAIERS